MSERETRGPETFPVRLRGDGDQQEGSVPNHPGARYIGVLARLHEWLSPTSYFEIGTFTGESLSIASCASIAVDPAFRLGNRDFLGKKPFCALYRMTADAFFREYDPTRIFNRPIDLAFLDGKHHCEYLLRDFANTERHCRRESVIALHDCVPVELAIADRTASPSSKPERAGWWAGDVWRTILALQKYRPDLGYTVIDSHPTGLVLITNLNSQSTLLRDNYDKIVREMMTFSLQQIGLKNFFSMIGMESTGVIDTKEKMIQRFRHSSRG